MALSFSTNTWQLVNLGLSIGDIATLAGVGRSGISWLIAHARDEQLLDLWKVDMHELGLRSGLIDPVTLNKRWGRRITFLQNGRVRSREVAEGGTIENMNQFTWAMTVVTCCLDVATSSKLLQEVVVALTIRLFENKTAKDIEQYLQYEIPQHIQGWRSAACAREMSRAAREKWAKQEKGRVHLPGFIPNNEAEELVNFLHWLVGTKETSFLTASSDIFALAQLLQYMGFDLIRTGVVDDIFDESVAAVILDQSVIGVRKGTSSAPHDKYRKGMRIPLQYMVESVSLWPGSADNNNKKRRIFSNGMTAASQITIKAVASPWGNRDTDISICVMSKEVDPISRIETEIFELGEKYLLLNTQIALDSLASLVDSWHTSGSMQRAEVVQGLGLVGRRGDDFEMHAEFQVFLLGYYYAAISSMVDTTQLSRQEAFGSWGWNDLDFFDFVRAFTKTKLNHKGNGSLFWKFQVLKLIAYLFAGADADQLSQVVTGAIGVLAKLSIVSAALMGSADTPEKITKFFLLDSDSSGIPSTERGLVFSSKQPRCESESPEKHEVLKSYEPAPGSTDFTSHIEPAWGFDTNQCLVAFRYKGRLVHRVSPAEMEASLLEWFPAVSYDTAQPPCQFNSGLLGEWNLRLYQEGNDSESLETVTADTFTPYVSRVSHSDFCGGKILQGIRTMDTIQVQGQPLRWVRDSVIIIATRGLSKARCCIIAMYSDHFADKVVTLKDFPWNNYFQGCILVETRNGGLLVLT
jgi:hypothetical protein